MSLCIQAYFTTVALSIPKRNHTKLRKQPWTRNTGSLLYYCLLLLLYYFGVRELLRWLDVSSKKNLTTHEDQVSFIPTLQGLSNICKSINVLHPTNKLKNKSHMIITIDEAKASGKTEHLFMIKNLKQTGYRKIFLTTVKTLWCSKPKATIILHEEILGTFPLKSENMFTFTITIQYSSGKFMQICQTRKWKQKDTDWKGKSLNLWNFII